MSNYNKLQVLSGDKLTINKDIVISHPTLKDIKDIGEDTYGRFIKVFCSKPFDLAVFLFKEGIDYEEITTYQMFNMLFPSLYYKDEGFRDIFDIFFNSKQYYNITSIKKQIKEKISDGDLDEKDRLELKLKEITDNRRILIPSIVNDETIYSFIGEDSKKIQLISKDNIEELQTAIKMLTGFSNQKPKKYKNKFSKEMDLEYQLELEEIAQKEEDNNSIVTMADLIGAIVLDTSYTYESVWDMPIYQFHSCTRMILKRDEYKNTMTGIYSGSLDPKKINMKDIYWLSSKK